MQTFDSRIFLKFSSFNLIMCNCRKEYLTSHATDRISLTPSSIILW